MKSMASTKPDFHETHNHTTNVCQHLLCRTLFRMNENIQNIYNPYPAKVDNMVSS